jgi:hypothetical protein
VERCAPLAATSAVNILPASLSSAVYDVIGSAGQRRFAFSRDSLTLFTFDERGSVSTQLTEVAGVATDGTLLHVVFDDGQRAFLQRYDAALVPVGSPSELGDFYANGMAIAASPTGTLVSWTDGEQLFGDVLSTRGVSRFSTPVGASGSRCRSSALATAHGFVVAWTCRDRDTELHFAAHSAGAELTTSSLAIEAGASLELVDFKAYGSEYLALLEELQTRTAYVVRLRSDGQPLAPIRAIEGLDGVFSLSVSARGIGVTGMLANGTTALGRILPDPTLTVTDVWSCLDSALPGGRAALDADAESYVALVRYGNGSEWLIRAPF